MNKTQELLSNIVIYNKYAKYLEAEKRRETWEEIIARYLKMMIKKYPQLKEDINQNGKFLYEKKVLPSMRSLQFAGAAIEKNESRGYNCSYLPIDDYRAFNELMFLLLGGTGVGFSVQYHHVDKLPEIRKPLIESKFLIGDSIEGWADAVKALMKSYFGYTKNKPRFDYTDIRAKGERLVTAGGKAPGPEPLKICLVKIEALLNDKPENSKLTPFECHRICCFIADAVLAGGIRRAALISLFSFDDKEMATCKHGEWYIKYPELGRSNNSATILRNRVKKEEFDKLWEIVVDSNSGEPGLYFTNDPEYGSNPCCFTGDTNILTSTGYKKIGTLVGEEELINANGEIVNGLIWSNGIKKVSEVLLSDKTIFKCTPDHRFLTIDGIDNSIEYLIGKRLQPYFQLNKRVSEYTKYGFIQGDGSLGRLSSISHKGLEIYIGEKDGDILELFNLEKQNDSTAYYVTGFNEVLRSLKFSQDSLETRCLPETFSSWESQDQKDFIKGMYSANGSIIKNHRIAYKTVSKVLAHQLVNYLSNIGITTYITTNKEKTVEFSNGNYICKESYDINISRYKSILKFAEVLNFVHSYKQESLIDLIKVKAPKVISINEIGEEEVFDFNLDDNKHWGVIEGVIAHNCEISLRPFTFCNLTEINAGTIGIDSDYEIPSTLHKQTDFNERARVAAFFGTLQAGFVDFHYLRPIWQKNTEKDALIGVGITGICNGNILDLNLKETTKIVKEENALIANKIGINKAARTTTIKPSGTTSCVVGTSSGIHAWHSKFYIRNMQCKVGDDLYTFFIKNYPELIKIMDFDTNSAVIGIPQQAPETAILRENETAVDMLERVKKFNIEWVQEGHRRGPNTNNVSATISVDNEWNIVGEWMWENKSTFNGLSVLPYDNGSYRDAPFEVVSKEVFEAKWQYIEQNPIDLTKILEKEDMTNLTGEVACAGGACELIY